MKKFILMTIVISFISMGCMASNAQRGAALGGIGGMAGSLIGKGDRRTTALYGAGGAALGYFIGNEMDKNNTTHTTQYSRVPNSDGYYSDQSPTPRTECRKIITRRIENGKTIEIVEERCDGRKVEYSY